MDLDGEDDSDSDEDEAGGGEGIGIGAGGLVIAAPAFDPIAARSIGCKTQEELKRCACLCCTVGVLTMWAVSGHA